MMMRIWTPMISSTRSNPRWTHRFCSSFVNWTTLSGPNMWHSIVLFYPSSELLSKIIKTPTSLKLAFRSWPTPPIKMSESRCHICHLPFPISDMASHFHSSHNNILVHHLPNSIFESLHLQPCRACNTADTVFASVRGLHSHQARQHPNSRQINIGNELEADSRAYQVAIKSRSLHY
jgi:hypothetical protein